MSLSWEEVSSANCQTVQTYVFGETLTEDSFNAIDTDGNGEIDGEEAAEAIEAQIKAQLD